jgi:hypothetical protein
MNKESQNKQILSYLQAGHRLTPLDALYKFGSLRLSARIYDLKRQGVAITSDLIAITSPSAIGGKKHVQQYFIKRNENINEDESKN